LQDRQVRAKARGLRAQRNQRGVEIVDDFVAREGGLEVVAGRFNFMDCAGAS
jgi:hypothetical protein